jgi:4-amino-4-deoxy-L-arabinose transferase-like glycosyltransferase
VARAVDSGWEARRPSRRSLWSRPRSGALHRWSFTRLALALALVGALHGLLYVPFVSNHIQTDSWTYTAAGEAILDASYSTPLQASSYYVHPLGFFDHTGRPLGPAVLDLPERQAFRPPGYPLFLAALGGGEGAASENAVLLAQALLFGAGVWLLALTVRRWWGPAPALAAAAVYALDPYSKHYVTLVLSEALSGFLALASAYAFTRAWQQRSLAWWAASGTLAASLTLTRAVFVFVVPLLILAALARRSPPRARLWSAGAVALCAAALLAPWLAWTSSVTGKPVLASWGEGYNLLLAAHGEGLGRTQTDVSEDREFLRDYESVLRLAPTTAELRANPEAHPRYMARADAELRGLARGHYGDRLADEPAQVGWEFLYRAFFLWNAHEDWLQPGGLALALLRAVDVVVLVFIALGTVLAIGRGGAGRAVALSLLVYTAIIATHHVEARFAMPVRGLALAFAALGVMWLLSRLPLGRTPAP